VIEIEAPSDPSATRRWISIRDVLLMSFPEWRSVVQPAGQVIVLAFASTNATMMRSPFTIPVGKVTV
jgi:hypothetical protein